MPPCLSTAPTFATVSPPSPAGSEPSGPGKRTWSTRPSTSTWGSAVSGAHRGGLAVEGCDGGDRRGGAGGCGTPSPDCGWVTVEHWCLAYAEDSELASAAAGFLSEGVRGGQQVGYFGWGREEELRGRVPGSGRAPGSPGGARC